MLSRLDSSETVKTEVEENDMTTSVPGLYDPSYYHLQPCGDEDGRSDPLAFTPGHLLPDIITNVRV